MSRHLYQGNIYPVLLIRLLLALLFFSLSRSLFYFFNFHYFRDLDAAGVLLAFLAGIRFDITAVIILNAPYILMNVFPGPIRTRSIWQRTANILYVFFNIAGFAFNTIDTVYFRFTSKRMTADIFSFIETGEDDFIGLIPRFISDFIWEVLAWIFLLVVFIFVSSLIRVRQREIRSWFRYYSLNIAGFMLAASLAVIGIRGGFQLRPITIIDAGRYVEAKNVSLVLNTPFSIIKSFGHTGLKEVEYYDDEAVLHKVFNPVHEMQAGDPVGAFHDYNVVVIIMESFSTEYIGSLNGDENGRTYTPHLDTIIRDGLAYRGYANGKQSIEALPAIVAGIPSLMIKPYITSAYGGNNIGSLASMLGELGYTSSFYHGGRNGTMGFESFIEIAGFDNYYGKDEYGHDEDFDGNWGIYDEAFFSYFKEHLDKASQPFLSCFFSLSSHHPYAVPDEYTGKFDKGTLDIHESIMYADYALGRFFREARRSSWFDHTLFVITADHTSLSYDKRYQSREGIYAIPLVFYMPEKISAALNPGIAQQADILPSVLSFLGYQKHYIAFGNNLFDSISDRYSVNHLDGTYQLIKDGWSLQFDGGSTVTLFPLELNYMAEGRQLSGEDAASELLGFLKAYIQQYNHRLINNQLIIYHRDE
ncbi:MAG: sulfatase-like hydrolase/transferase [Bacteroidota bacterium]